MNGSPREKGTFISEEALRAFCQVAVEIERENGALLQLAEIIVRRWSYLAGAASRDMPLFPPEKIRLTERLGLVIYCSQPLSEGIKKQIVDKTRKALSL